MEPICLPSALQYAARDWPVFPCKPRGKAPLTVHGVKDATVDPDRIRAWFNQWPAANVAIACGHPGPTVLDVDDLNQGRPALELMARVGAPDVATGRGRQFYLAGTGQNTVTLGYGELRGHGSYVVAPPSIHPTGKEYVWLVTPDGPLPPIPPELTGGRRGAGTGQLQAPERIPYGQRHDALKDMAVRFLRAGITDVPTLEQLIRNFYETRCVTTPKPRRDEFRQLAMWATTSDIADRERELAATADSDGKKKTKKETGLDRPPHGDAPLKDHRDYVHLAAGLPGAVHVQAVVREGARATSRLKIDLTNGQRILFGRQELVATRGHWARTVVMHTNGIANPANVSEWQGVQVLRSLCILADAPPELREHEDMEHHLNEFEAMTDPSEDHDIADPEGRYNAIAHAHAHGTWEPRGRTDQPLLIVDKQTGRRYLRAGEILAYLNWRGFGIAPADLESRLNAIGLARVVLNGREGPRIDGKRRRTNRMVVYELPPDSE